MDSKMKVWDTTKFDAFGNPLVEKERLTRDKKLTWETPTLRYVEIGDTEDDGKDKHPHAS